MPEENVKLRDLKDLWDGGVASLLDESEKLRYQSNLLDAGLRITNFGGANTIEQLRNKLAGFYAQHTLTHEPIGPVDCAEAVLFLASDRTRCTAGHLIPMNGGLRETFLR